MTTWFTDILYLPSNHQKADQKSLPAKGHLDGWLADSGTI